jgi:hypothetical protein
VNLSLSIAKENSFSFPFSFPFLFSSFSFTLFPDLGHRPPSPCRPNSFPSSLCFWPSLADSYASSPSPFSSLLSLSLSLTSGPRLSSFSSGRVRLGPEPASGPSSVHAEGGSIPHARPFLPLRDPAPRPYLNRTCRLSLAMRASSAAAAIFEPLCAAVDPPLRPLSGCAFPTTSLRVFRGCFPPFFPNCWCFEPPPRAHWNSSATRGCRRPPPASVHRP